MLIRERGFHIYTDHRNLVFLFDPFLFSENLKRHNLDKIQRWALRLSGLRYTIQHISGDDNVWADLLTRWGAPKQTPARAFSVRLYQSKTVTDPPAGSFCYTSSGPHLRDLASETFVWPSESEIKLIQSEAAEDSTVIVGTERFVRDDSGLFKNASGVVWVPHHASNLICRLLVISHQGSAGHRAVSATRLALSSRFYWPSLSSDVTDFVSRCHHCMINANGSMVPLPFGEAVHWDTPNIVIHFIFRLDSLKTGFSIYFHS